MMKFLHFVSHARLSVNFPQNHFVDNLKNITAKKEILLYHNSNYKLPKFEASQYALPTFMQRCQTFHHEYIIWQNKRNTQVIQISQKTSVILRTLNAQFLQKLFCETVKTYWLHLELRENIKEQFLSSDISVNDPLLANSSRESLLL